MKEGTSQIPIIDVAPLVTGVGDEGAVSSAGRGRCRLRGFFYVVGHGVSEERQCRLDERSHSFFAQDAETKLEIRMELAGKAWRGYFPVGGVLTSGRPDLKEGLYFGAELQRRRSASACRSRTTRSEPVPARGSGIRRHDPGVHGGADRPPSCTHAGHRDEPGSGARLFPRRLHGRSAHPVPDPPLSPHAARAGSRAAVGRRRAHRLRRAHHPQTGRRGRSPGQNRILLVRRATRSELFRMQHRRHARSPDASGSIAPRPTACRIDSGRGRLSHVLLRSGIRCARGTDRLERRTGFPADDGDERWDHVSVHDFEGTYGDYVLGKVSKVFPELSA